LHFLQRLQVYGTTEVTSTHRYAFSLWRILGKPDSEPRQLIKKGCQEADASDRKCPITRNLLSHPAFTTMVSLVKFDRAQLHTAILHRCIARYASTQKKLSLDNSDVFVTVHAALCVVDALKRIYTDAVRDAIGEQKCAALDTLYSKLLTTEQYDRDLYQAHLSQKALFPNVARSPGLPKLNKNSSEHDDFHVIPKSKWTFQHLPASIQSYIEQKCPKPAPPVSDEVPAAVPDLSFSAPQVKLTHISTLRLLAYQHFVAVTYSVLTIHHRQHA
jgi:hypothetical protein